MAGSEAAAIEWRVGGRACALGALAILAAAAAAHWLPGEKPSADAARVVLAAVAIGTVPGALVLLACGRAWSEIELFGLGAAVSFVLVQFLTIGAIVGHWSAGVSLAILAAIVAALLVRVWRAGAMLRVSAGRVTLLASFAIAGGLLYLQGAPYSSSEDQIHVAVIRRLAFLAHPRRDDLYFIAGAVDGFYPYPFPGIHYLIGLMSRVAGLDPLFVYHKLRAFWAPVTLAYVYLAAEALFGSSVAVVSAATSLAFVLGGTFANSYNFFWGQLAPYSHASDVAMGVLLPALITLTLRYITSEAVRDRVVFGASLLGLTFMLCIVHTREVIQQCVYCACLVAACLATPVDRRQKAAWAIGLLAATVVIAGTYELWHRTTIGFVTGLIDQQRAGFIDQIRRASWFDRLVGRPSQEMSGSQLLFYGWNPWMLMLTPVVLVAFRGRAAVRAVALSIFVYLLIVRLPLFSIPYTLGSYFEIQVSSVRNFVFFIHVYTGVVLLLLATWLATVAPAVAIATGVSAVVALALVWRFGGLWLFAHQDVMFVPLIAAYAGALWWEWRHARSNDVRVEPAPRRIWAAITLALAACTFVPGSVTASNAERSGSPLTVAYADSVKTPSELLAIRGGCTDAPDVPLPFQPAGLPRPAMTGRRLNCPPPPRLLQWARAALPPEAIIAASKFNEHPIVVYLPAQIVTWPSTALTYHDETAAFPAYYELYDRSIRRHGAEPFFNAAETREERAEFLRRLRITHVLLDPGHYAALKPQLDHLPGLLTSIYDDGTWAIYLVVA